MMEAGPRLSFHLCAHEYMVDLQQTSLSEKLTPITIRQQKCKNQLFIHELVISSDILFSIFKCPYGVVVGKKYKSKGFPLIIQNHIRETLK